MSTQRKERKKYGREWKRIRDAYIKRFPNCEVCQAHMKIVPATEIHHITPLSRGGTHDRVNLLALCHECHQKIHEIDRAEHKKVGG